ncbi:LysR family transcriptional regulator [Brevundimonas sp. LM2]|uniref:LysR family transcriptional regulator n=1 Tax=Brevundimonas sp. LM2 TaxID=1938605 RepID=UPI00098396A6|nr:LysR family transcriptional regulator [Brevundimonas sp. LM2]AQR63124.1 LysR family transcriptional regulator [Brevundimonas sp. LM2]
MELVDIRAFVRIAEEQGISAAARALGAPKSTVSRSLNRLEESLESVLIERHTRQLRLTDAGQLFLPHARRILADVDEAGSALEGLLGAPRGTLRVNAAVTFALGLVAPMLPGFIQRYPDLRVVLETENRVIDLGREDVDVAIRIGRMPDSDLMARKLGTIQLWPVASPAYLSERGTPNVPNDLLGHSLLGWIDQPSEWAFSSQDGGTYRISIAVGSVVPEPAVLQILLLGGMGIGRLPDFLARSFVNDGRLVRLLPAFETETVDVHAVYPAHRNLSAKVPLFVDALRRHVETHSTENGRVGRE